MLQYDIHPAIGLSFGPIAFLVCVLGGLGNMIGGFVAAFIFAQFISVGGFFFHLEWGYVIAFVFFIAVMFWRPQGLFGSASHEARPALDRRGAARGAAVRRHRQLSAALMIMCLLWAYVYTELGAHGPTRPDQPRPRRVPGHRRVRGGDAVESFRPVALARRCRSRCCCSLVVALLIGYPCFRLKIVGHYFALVTLALSEVARMVIVALRDQTGGSLGATPNTALAQGNAWSLAALQFSSKVVWFYIILGVLAGRAVVWTRVDRAMARLALEAISQEEDAAASIGINVTRLKLGVTLISALMTCVGGVLYAQYQLYVNPETVSGIGISLQMVFGAIAGGMFVHAGPDGRRGVHLAAAGRAAPCARRRLKQFPALDLAIYGLMLVLFIIFMPKGILGAALEWRARRRATPAAARG